VGYFDACEACGQSESLVIDGLCHRCQRLADRAAYGSSTLPRVSGHGAGDGRFIVRTTLVPRENDDRKNRPLPGDGPEPHHGSSLRIRRLKARVRGFWEGTGSGVEV
jgi:hypothetical protein